ncbi:MAG: efflux RND transporter permease subunit [Porticoccaceae bacterium]
MWLSDVSVKRPVFATVISLLLVAFGLVAFDRLPLREYPDIDPPIISIRTEYIGASAAVVESRISKIIEDSIAGIEGIKTISSSSRDGVSNIELQFQLDRDIDIAANDVRDRVARIASQLPDEADPPQVEKADADEQVIMWLNLVSDRMDSLALTDYANRYLVDRFSVIEGVARVRLSGDLEYAMRIWLDRKALAARNLTVNDVETALRAQNVELPAGTIKSSKRDFVVQVDRGYVTADDFSRLVIRPGDDDYLVRIGDIARVELAPAEHRRLFRGNGVNMIGMGIVKQSTGNTLEVARDVRALVAALKPELPPGLEIRQSVDTSVFIDSAIAEVYSTLFIAAVLVVLVIFLFLGDFRAMLIPAVTVPVSLIATVTVLQLFGYSLNMLTLLALVLAIGLVVDDGIVVLENIHRRLVDGESPLVASYRGARQVGFAVVATTAVLIAVFVPITFLDGNVGRLFAEFAVAMAAAVFFSSIVALTLSPVMCSKLLNTQAMDTKLARFVENLLERMQRSYARILHLTLNRPIIALTVFVVAVAGSGLMFSLIPGEFTPREDRGIVFLMLNGPEGASHNYTERYALQVEERLMPLVESGEVTRLLVRAPAPWGGGDAYNRGVGILVLDEWERRRPVDDIVADIRRRVADISGIQILTIIPQPLGGRARSPVQFVIGGGSYEQLAQWRDTLLEEAANNPGLINLDSDYKETKPQLRIKIDRNLAGDLGVSVIDVSRTLETLLGSRRVTTFLQDGEEYDVILEAEPAQQSTPQDLENIYVRSDTSGLLVPLANLINITEVADVETYNRYNRVRAITIEAGLSPGYTLGEALSYLENVAREKLPDGVTVDYKGESLDYKDSGGSVYFIFALALLVVFLVLAAQFESFINPFVILLTVPLAIAGGLLGLLVTGQSLNIYSQVALIMLVGLATKNGILLVEFANQLRDEGMDFRAALIQASQQRLRPIVMTAITTVVGAVPLILAFGAGSESRYVIGVVVVFGVSLATLFTLVVVPSAYQLLARRTGSPQAVTRELERQLTEDGS